MIQSLGDDSESGSFKPLAACCMTTKHLKTLDKHALTDACPPGR